RGRPRAASARSRRRWGRCGARRTRRGARASAGKWSWTWQGTLAGADGPRACTRGAPLSFVPESSGRARAHPCTFGAGCVRSLVGVSLSAVRGPERLRALRLRQPPGGPGRLLPLEGLAAPIIARGGGRGPCPREPVSLPAPLQPAPPPPAHAPAPARINRPAGPAAGGPVDVRSVLDRSHLSRLSADGRSPGRRQAGDASNLDSLPGRVSAHEPC